MNIVNSKQLKTKLLWTIVPILVTLNQICMRVIAQQSTSLPFGLEWIKLVITNPLFIAAILCEIGSFLVWIKILSTENLSVAFPISSISYISILLAGSLIFHEKISLVQIIGSALIIAGCWLIGTASKKPRTIS